MAAMIDYMFKSSKNNRALLKKRKSLKELYKEAGISEVNQKLHYPELDVNHLLYLRRKLKINARLLVIKQIILILLLASGTYYLLTEYIL